MAKEQTLLSGPAAETRLKTFIAKFSPADQARIRAARRVLRRQLAGACEMVYDNYNFFVIGYGATDRPSDAVVSLAAQANRLSLCFLHGATLPDPDRILCGNGRQVRTVPLASAADLNRPELRRLVEAAFASSPLTGGRVRLIIRSVSSRQRPRRKRVRGAS